MVELVDTYALGAYAARCAGSSPVPGTKILAISAHLGDFLALLDDVSHFSQKNRPTERIVVKNFII